MDNVISATIMQVCINKVMSAYCVSQALAIHVSTALHASHANITYSSILIVSNAWIAVKLEITNLNLLQIMERFRDIIEYVEGTDTLLTPLHHPLSNLVQSNSLTRAWFIPYMRSSTTMFP